MRKLFTSCVLTLAFFGIINNAVGQGPWKISDETGACGDSEVWATLNNGVLTITGTGCMADFWCTGAPPFEGQAQWYNENLHTTITKVIIKDNVQNIGDKAFIGCTSLTSVEFESLDVWRIGKKAFEGCSNLQTIKIPSSVTEIEGEAFLNCSKLHTVELANGSSRLNFIGYQSDNICDGTNYNTYNWFLGCNILTTLHLGRDINNWGTDNNTKPIFYIKNTLTTLGIGNTVIDIPCEAFKNCTNLITVDINDGDFILTFWHSSGLGEHFKGCDKMEILYLGRNLAPQGGYFWGGFGAPFKETPIKYLTIGNSVTKINGNSFHSCNELKSLTFVSGSNLDTIEDDAFHGCSNLQTELIIPEKVTTIGKGAFIDCFLLPLVTIPPSVVEINAVAFKNCKNLKTVNIKGGSPNDALLEIWGDAWSPMNEHFKGCDSLETVYLDRNLAVGGGFGWSYNGAPFREISGIRHVTIGENVSKINDNSFRDCTQLHILTFLGNNLKEIGNYAFYGCCELDSIICYPTDPPTIYQYTFGGCGKSMPNCTVYVCPNCIEAYQKADYWKEFTNYQPLGIEETPLTQLQIFPNPANSEIFIQSELKIEKVEVYSLMGTLLMSKNNFSGKISISALAQGIYLLKVYTDKGLVVRKFIKE